MKDDAAFRTPKIEKFGKNTGLLAGKFSAVLASPVFATRADPFCALRHDL